MKEIAPHIVINTMIRFGKPVIKGTRITVDEALGFLASGMDFDEIEQEYSLKRVDVQAAIDYAAGLMKNQEVYLSDLVPA